VRIDPPTLLTLDFRQTAAEAEVSSFDLCRCLQLQTQTTFLFKHNSLWVNQGMLNAAYDRQQWPKYHKCFLIWRDNLESPVEASSLIHVEKGTVVDFGSVPIKISHLLSLCPSRSRDYKFDPRTTWVQRRECHGPCE
jgi:hypothetical protein